MNKLEWLLALAANEKLYREKQVTQSVYEGVRRQLYGRMNRQEGAHDHL